MTLVENTSRHTRLSPMSALVHSTSVLPDSEFAGGGGIVASPAHREPHHITLRNPLADSTWDASVRHCPQASFYHSAAWARVLHDTYGYRPFYLLISAGGLPRAVLPIMEVQSRLTGRRGVSLPFSDDCEAASKDRAAFQGLFRVAQALGDERGWRYLECRGAGALLPGARTSVTYFGHRVRLTADEELLFSSFDGAVRRAIRKAWRSGLSVEVSDSPQAVRDFYELFCLTRKRHGLPPQPFLFYENIRRHVLAEGRGTIVLVRLHRRPVAAAVFFHGPDSVVMKFAASDLRFQHLRINNLALWTAMKHYARAGYQTMDFGRTALTNDGLRSFKRRWGASERLISYHRFDLRENAFVLSRAQPAPTQELLFKVLPVSVSRIAGVLFYRHMA